MQLTHMIAVTMELSERPWEALPPDLASILRPKNQEIAADVVATVRDRVAAYRDDAPAVERLRLGVEHALDRFSDLIDGRPPDPTISAGLYRSLGRAVFDEGRTLDQLHAVYRIAARVAWRWTEYAAEEARLPSTQLHVLAESIFVYIDELSALASEGFAAAASEAAGERHQRRAQLVATLLVVPPLGQAALDEAARRADWKLPAELAVVVLEGDRVPAEIAGRLGPGVLAGIHAGTACLVVPDPGASGMTALFERALEPGSAAIGPAVSPGDAARSLEWARRTHALAGRGLLVEPSAIPRADHHLVELLLASEAELLNSLADRRLGPLLELAPRSRERLAETLLAWLDHGRSAPAAAALLHAHPQTVRYRLGQLRELLGTAIDDPAQRFELELALRARRLLDRPG
jgi:hypothetical protein